MKYKLPFSALFLSFLLASCGGVTSSSSVSYSSPSSMDSSQISSTLDEDDQIMNRNDGVALTYQDVSSPYQKGTSTNPQQIDYENIYVNQPTNALADDFAFGVDCSSLYDVERSGGRFYDEDGDEEDLFVLLRKGGANYARFRLWVDPFDKDGHSYGGGSNDISTDIYLAKRAQSAGMKILIDFHYSDSWADPAKQWAPKGWMNLDSQGKPAIQVKTQYKRVGDYTSHALNAFKNAGVTVNAVQIGNETNNGMAGADNAVSKYFADMIHSGVATAKSVFPEVKTIVHLAGVNIPSSVYRVYDNLKKRNVDWDVCGLSYYPYWHGGRDNLLEVMKECASRYEKEVMIVETSWGYTDENAAYSSNQFSTAAFGEVGGYVTSAQGQASEIADLVDCLSKVPDQKGVGLFYWEPGWLPVEGSGWITKYGAYYNDNGYDASSASDLSGYTDKYCYSSWANQTWFTYSGKALASYKTFQHIIDGDKTVPLEITGLLNDSFSATYNLSDGKDSIPSTGKVITNIGSYLTKDISWNQEEIDSLPSLSEGHHTIHGTLEGNEVTCDVLVYYNYVKDNSFENQNTLQGNNANEYAVSSPWSLSSSVNGVRVESKSEGNRTGNKYFHWWGSSAYSFSLSQKLSKIPAGTYRFSIYTLTHLKTEYGGYSSIGLWYQIGNEGKKVISMLENCKGYASGMVEWAIPAIIVPSESDVTIGLDADCGASSWGHSDDWSFVRSE